MLSALCSFWHRRPVDEASSTASLLSHNVVLVMLFTFFDTATRSLFLRYLLTVWIKMKTDSNLIVGYATGTSGVMLILCAFPSGVLADRWGRERTLRLAGFVGVGSVMLSVVTFSSPNLVLIFACMAAWGVYDAANNSALESIFADSLAPGYRSRVFAWKHSVMVLGNCAGPVVSSYWFWKHGDTWDASVLSEILTVGSVCAIIPTVTLFLFSDAYRLPSESHGVSSSNDDAHLSPGSKLMAKSRARSDSVQHDRTPVRRSRFRMATQVHERCPSALRMFLISTIMQDPSTYVPRLIALSDFTTAIGAGLTVKFFPLFFKQILNMSPLHVNLTYIAVNVATSVYAIIAQWQSRKIGRIPTLVCNRVAAIVALFVLAYSGDANTVAALYVVRTAFMNCLKPLTRSILMDMVDPAQRGKWNSFESVSRFTWAGSAALGGYLIDAFSFRFCFIFTGLVYSVATIPLVLLVPAIAEEHNPNSSSDPKVLHVPLDDMGSGSDSDEISIELASRSAKRKTSTTIAGGLVLQLDEEGSVAPSDHERDDDFGLFTASDADDAGFDEDWDVDFGAPL